MRNKAENFINQIDTTLNNKDLKADENQKAEVKKLRDELKTALDNNDMATLKTKLDQLEQAAHQMSEAMYQQQQANTGTNPEENGQPKNDDVQDAQFTEKK